MDIGGIVLQKILLEPEQSLEIWPKLKLSFFGTEYTSIYSEVNKYYNRFSKLPNFAELNISVRTTVIKNNISALEALEAPDDIDLDIAYEALINEYTQNEALIKIDSLLDIITLLDTEEIKTNISDILLYLEEKTHTSEQIYLMSDIILVDRKEIENRITLGLNATNDSVTGGYPTDELIFIGGMRGAGKSVVAGNIAINQYEEGNSVVYFSIEMRARSIYTRIMSALAGVSHSKLRNGECSKQDMLRLVETRAKMFINYEQALEDYKNNEDYDKFEVALTSLKLKVDNQIVIVDNQRLTLADIDLNIQKFKAQFKDNLKVVVIDYLNAIEIEDIYNWKSQLTISATLKNLAEKYNIVIVAPYQIDASGEARFSKAILDKADVSIILDAQDDHIAFKSTKTRNVPAFEFKSQMDWDSLRLSNLDAKINDEEEKSDEDMEF